MKLRGVISQDHILRLLAAVRQGAAAVTADVRDRVAGWWSIFDARPPATAAQ